MSRSNPTSQIAHPCTTWFEWNGAHGALEYYDKKQEKRVRLPSPQFTFIYLDELYSVSGWHERSKSGITSNEVRDSRTQAMAVKSFKGGLIAAGFYANIKDTVNAAGGYFSTNVYVAGKDGNGQLQIMSIRFAGAALNAWIEFSRKHHAELHTMAVKITGFSEGRKGAVTFRIPQFQFEAVSQASNDQAVKLDLVLQEYLTEYFKKTASSSPSPHPAEAPQPDAVEDHNQLPEPPPDLPVPPADDEPF